jgi:hypothetical protein
MLCRSEGNAMTQQPPDQPPNQPPDEPGAGSPPTQPMFAAASPAAPTPPAEPGAGSPPTQPMFAAASPAAPLPPAEPKRNLWRRATSTRRGVWAVGLGAGALAVLMILGIGLAGLAVLRNHDRAALTGNRESRILRGQDRLDRDNGRRPGFNDRNRQRPPARPGVPGLGDLGRTALHGQVTAPVNGSMLALVFQRGEVTAVSATSITIKSSDGFTDTYGLTPATTVRGSAVKGGQAFVLARASDKVAISATATRARVGATPTPTPTLTS